MRLLRASPGPDLDGGPHRPFCRPSAGSSISGEMRLDSSAL